jgi:plastocyanin
MRFWQHPARHPGAVLASLLGLLGIMSCGGGGKSSYATPSAPTPTPSSSPVIVNIVGSSGNKAFQPNPVQVNGGDNLAFRNADTATHHIVLDDGSADLGMLSPGVTSAAIKASGPATNFHCTIHPSMVGSINGSAAPEPPPCTGYCG